MQINQVAFMRLSRCVDVAIVGAGFSGSMVAVHLAQTLKGASEIALIEKARRAGPGIAYSTDNASPAQRARGPDGCIPRETASFL
jgi:glycine/D-amino acid oxidase-like deaminating enzyme